MNEQSHENDRLSEARAMLEALVNEGTAGATELVLASFPELCEIKEFVLELVYLEYVLNEERGIQTNPETMHERFPQLGDDLIRMLQVDQALNQRGFAAGIESTAFEDDFLREHDLTGGAVDRIGEYLLLGVIGRGGMGIVYKARQFKLNRLVAVKTIHVSDSLSGVNVSRFRMEAELAAKLQHPNIVQIYEIGTHEGIPYFSMELVDSGSLMDALSQGPLDAKVAALLMETIAQAVAYAHQKGVIHRDLKPANILLSQSDRTGAICLDGSNSNSLKIATQKGLVEPKIADFGLAKSTETGPQFTQTGTLMGTPSYMAPEQTNADPLQVGTSCDIYALGAILYHALVGRPPFHAATVLETLRQVKHDTPPSIRASQPKIPRDLETICLTCLHKDPRRRYASAEMLAEDLRRFLNGESIHARQSSSFEKVTKWIRRHPAQASLLSTILLSVIGVSMLWWRAETSRRSEHALQQRSKRILYAQDIRLAQFDIESGNSRSAVERLERTDAENRNWEWKYLRQQCGDALCEFSMMGTLSSVALSSDGSMVAAGTRGAWGTNDVGEVAIWNVGTRQVVHRLKGHTSGITQVRFSPDGRYIATASVVYGTPSIASSSGSSDGGGGLRVWDVKSGELVFSDSNMSAYSLAFAPDSSKLAVGLFNGRLTYVSIGKIGDEGIQVTNTFQAHREFITDLAFRPDGKFLASTSRDGTMRVWSTEKGKPNPRVDGLLNANDVRQVSWNANCRDLVVVTYEKQLRYLQQVSDETVEEKGIVEKPGIRTARYSPDGMYLLVSTRGEPTVILNTRTNKQEGSIKSSGVAIEIQAAMDGRSIATASSDGVVRVWDLADCLNKPNKEQIASADTAWISMSHNRKEIATAKRVNPRRRLAASGKPRIEVLDGRTGKINRKLYGHTDWLTTVAYRFDGDQIASGSLDETIRLWEPDNEDATRVLVGHRGPVTSVAYLNDGHQLVSVGKDSSVRIWNVDTGVCEHNWSLVDHVPSRVYTFKGHNHFFVLTDDKVLLQFDSGTRQQTIVEPLHNQNVRCLDFSIDGQFIATAMLDGRILLWNVNDIVTNRHALPQAELRGHTAPATSIAFSPDGQRLVSGSIDGLLKLWDLGCGQELLSISEVVLVQDLLLSFNSDGDTIFGWEYDALFEWTINLNRSDTPTYWHKWQLKTAVESSNTYAQQYHLDRLIELEPDAIAHRRERGVLNMFEGKWREAENDLHVGIELDKGKSSAGSIDDIQSKWKAITRRQTWANGSSRVLNLLTAKSVDSLLVESLARCSMHLGDREGFDRYCSMLEANAIQQRDNVTALSEWAWLRALSADTQMDWKLTISTFRSALKNRDNDRVRLALSLVLIRAGEADEALVVLGKRSAREKPELVPTWDVLRAICFAKKGKLSEANAELSTFEQWQKRKTERSLRNLPEKANYLELDLPILVSEAEAMVRGTSVPNIFIE